MNPSDSESTLAPPRADAAMDSAAAASYQFDGFLLDPSQRQLTRDGTVIMLPPKAFDMLVLLIENRDRVMSKEELMTAIWRDAFVSEDSLSQIIFILRRSLGDDPSSPRLIATSHRRGYRFIAEVKAVDEEDTAPLPSAGPTEGGPDPHPHPELAAGPAVGGRRVGRWLFALLVVASSLASWFAGHWMLPRKAPSTAGRIRSVQSLPPSTTLGSGGLLSPDSRLLAFVAEDERSGKTQLWVRDLSTGTTQPLRDTEGAEEPFWSPDNKRVAFFSSGNLRVADLHGSTAQTIASTGLRPAGGSWSATDVILFAPRRSGLSAVASTGGPVRPVTTLDAATKESAHRAPRFLPDGRHFLYYVVSAEQSRTGTYIGALDGNGGEKKLVVDGSQAVYAEPGYLIFVRGNALTAQAFDLSHLRMTGQPITLAAGVSGDRPISEADGLLAFVERVPSNRLAWFNRSGDQLSHVETPTTLTTPMITRDGKELVASNGGRGDQQGIWLSDLDRGVFSRLTIHGGAPVPSPDNKRILFTSDHTNGVRDLYVVNRERGAGEESLLRTAENKLANDWTRDGRYIVYVSTNPKTKQDLWLLPTFGDHQPIPFLATPFNEIQGQVSPNGRWIAYASDETGAWEVYLQSFPVAGDKQIVSTGGGAQPQWRGDGQELFYLSADRVLMAVDVNPTVPLRIGRPKALFRTAVADLTDSRNRFAPSIDGQRFLVDSLDITTEKPQVVLLINWLTGSGQ